MNLKGIFLVSVLGAFMALAMACSTEQAASSTSPDLRPVDAAAAEITTAQQSQGSNPIGKVSAAEIPVDARSTTMTQQPTSALMARLTEPATAIAGTGNALVQMGNGDGTGILVRGFGEVSAVPDVAVLNLGVESFASTVANARDEANTAMAEVRTALEARGIPEADIQTKHFRINPRYTSREVTKCPEGKEMGVSSQRPSPTATPAPLLPPGGGTGMVVQEGCFTDRERIITGYEVGNRLEVKLRDLDAVGEVIDEVTEAGGDTIRFNGINFSLDDPSDLEDQALTAAIEDAIAKAEDMAEAAGVGLGGLLHISEGSVGQPGSPLFFGGAGLAMQKSATMTLVSAGSLEVSATVQALFAIDGN